MDNKDNEIIEEKLNKLSLNGITWKTWVSTGLTVLAGLNEILLISGIQTPLSELSDTTVTTALTVAFLVAVRAYSWWHNNSVTKKAQEADKEKNNK